MNKISLSAFKSSGFTLVEMMIVLALFMIIFTFSNISVSGLITKHSTDEFSEQFISEARRQQMRAMTGSISADGEVDHGIKFGGDSYTLFSGIYDVSNPNNITVYLEDNLEFTNVTFANSEIVFETITGELQNYSSASASLVVTNTANNQEITIQANQLGVFERL